MTTQELKQHTMLRSISTVLTLVAIPTLALTSALETSFAQTPASAPPVVPKGQDEPLPTMEAAQAFVQQGQFKEAAAAFGRISAADPKNGQAVFMHAYTLHASGDLKAAHDRHLEAAEFPNFRILALYNHACVHALWKETDNAFKFLKEAADAGFADIGQLEMDTDLDGLRDDPRFASFVDSLRPRPSLKSLAPERRFDFYAGEWTMRVGDAAHANLSVTPALGGAGWRVVMTDPQSGAETAQSLFVYDTGAKTWRNTYMSNAGDAISMAGGLEGAGMALAVESASSPSSMAHRAQFRDIERGGFVYAWQVTSDKGKTWKDEGIATFVRR